MKYEKPNAGMPNATNAKKRSVSPITKAVGGFLLVCCALTASTGKTDSRQQGMTGQDHRGAETRHARVAYGKLPLAFEANQERASDESVAFVARANGYALFLRPSEVIFTGRNGVSSGRNQLCEPFRLQFVGANPRPRISGLDRLPGETNYFLGTDPAKWRTGIPSYRKVRYEEVYPGVDLVFYGNQQELEYDWIVKPNGSPASIRLAVSGKSRLAVNNQGDLILTSGGCQVRHLRPRIYQEIAGVRTAVAGGYVSRGQRQFGFQVSKYDRNHPLTIDPVITYSALIGGRGIPPLFPADFSFFDQGLGIAVDDARNAYITGTTYSVDFPTVNPLQLQGARSGQPDAFVVKVNEAGTEAIYSTYLGGSVRDEGRGIAVDSAGNAYVVGVAGPDFPTRNPIQGTWGGTTLDGPDAFVTKLSPTGVLVYSTYLGGSGVDFANAVAVDSTGSAYVTGYTDSNNFPTTPGAFRRSLNPPSCFEGAGQCGDLFVAKLNPPGTALSYSTYLGGSNRDEGRAIAVDTAGSAYVTGTASRTDFPVTQGAFQRTAAGSPAFITKLNPFGSQLVYSTYLGGSRSDQTNGVAVDRAGNAYVTGWTESADFPITAGAFQPDKGPGRMAFATKLSAGGSSLVYSTYLGGSGDDFGQAIVVDTIGNAYVTGITSSRNFPIANAIQTTNRHCFEQINFCGFSAFITKLRSDGSRVLYSTYLGGSRLPLLGGVGSGNDSLSGDKGRGIALDASGAVYVVGEWRSDAFEFPLVGPLRMAQRGEASLIIKISEAGTTPLFLRGGITNAASFATGVTRGGLATLFGTGLSNVNGIVAATAFPLPTELSGTSVRMNTVPVPLLAVANVDGREQINFYVPFEISLNLPLTVTVVNNGAHSVPLSIGLWPAAHPGIFLVDQSTAAIQHGADFALVTADNPAAQGEVIVIYATGLGDVQPRPASGQPASASLLSRTVLTPRVTIGGLDAEVLFSGLTPGFVGLYQVNARIPQGISSGSVDVVITVEGQSSNTVKLAIR